MLSRPKRAFTILRVISWPFPSIAGLFFVVLSGAVPLAVEQERDTNSKPVRAWAAGPFETKVAFDGVFDPAIVKSVVGTTIDFEEKPSSAGSTRGYRGTLRVTAARLEDKGRTLVMVTDPHPRQGEYSFGLRGVKGLRSASGGDLKVRYNLEGFETSWESDDPQASGPVKGFLRDLESLKTTPTTEAPGKLSFATLLTMPSGRVTARLRSSRPVEATIGGEEALETIEPKAGSLGSTRFQVESNGQPVFLMITVPTGPGLPPLTLELALGEGDGAQSLRPIVSSQTTLPWVPMANQESVLPANPPNLDGGDPLLGKAVFQGATGKCSACHRIKGEGGVVGPDLTSLAGRDRIDVYRDIADPSSRIHPDYVSYTVAMKDGTVAVGTLRSSGADAVVVTNSEAKSTTIARDLIEEFRPSGTSIMPVGLVGALGEKNLRDLIAYLVTDPSR